MEKTKGGSWGGEKGQISPGGGVPPPKIFREGQEPPGIFAGGGQTLFAPPWI